MKYYEKVKHKTTIVETITQAKETVRKKLKKWQVDCVKKEMLK